MNLSYEQIIERIQKEKNIPKEEIESRINNKLNELSNLVSKEGAAHIIAHEYNVKIIQSLSKLKIKDLIPKTSFITLTAKVITIYPVREYKTEKRAGRVATMLVGDETEIIRCVIWDEHQIEQIKNIKEGDILKLKNISCRENNGFKEIHLNNKSQLIINPEGESIPQVNLKQEINFKKLSDIQENDFIKTTGTIVQIFEPRYFNVCPECDKKLKLEGQTYVCDVHKLISPKQIPIVNIFLDDGTNNIRGVFFRDQASSLLNIPMEEIKSANFEEIKKSLMGKQINLTGRITKNNVSNSLEIIARTVSEANPLEIAEILAK